MSTAFKLLIDGLAAPLELAHPGVTVYRNRRRPVSQSESKAIFVRLAGSQRQPDAPLGATDWETLVEVEAAARATSGAQDPADAVDDMVASCWATLLAAPLGLPDVTDIDSAPDLRWEFDALETPLASATFRLVVRHRTQANTLTPWSA
ncbi:hypothetical protein KIH07_16805 [Hydrogenophaga taeniospiralis]|uniref:hypothetical protein n=1 Tax=Hydrogenophaga taeniospiralis TaxID=65656 RepID=UPI001CFBC37A|nr:hypothetical protein [Hydrogenophaga taeniospiralis]MCB4365405.1 hypothetical protein [Hydrogenophaga taeniospiralis]